MQAPVRVPALAQLPAAVVLPHLVNHNGRARRQLQAQERASAFTPAERANLADDHISARFGPRRSVSCAATREAYPFHEDDYHRVGVNVIATQSGSHTSGNLLMYREDGPKVTHHNTQVLVLAVSGDSLLAITNYVQQKSSVDRPLALDLLWQILQRGQDISKSEWKLLRMAIVELRGLVFIGRLFFGREDTGEVVWDCDCRPSDGAWLALKSKCPIFVRKQVWDQNAMEMGAITQQYAAPAGIESTDQLTGTAALTTLRNDDPDPLKLLKRKLAVAIVEEDYRLAASLRDHPYMILHIQAVMHRQAGRTKEAARLTQELRMIIQREAESGSGIDRRE